VESLRNGLTPSKLLSRGAETAERARMLLINTVQGSSLTPKLVRWAVLRAWGVRSATYQISQGCWFGGPDVEIGAGTYVNFEVVFDNLGPIRIGARCDIGMRTMLVTSVHAVGPSSRRAGPLSGKPIVIEDGCWIGAGAVILPGVTVGAGCIVASGAVVSKDCEPNGLYAGTPARRVRELD
jgi:maltose O-acetyltransferase